MSHGPLPAVLLMLTTLFGYGVEPVPTLTPDPIPPAVRLAATTVAHGGVVDLMTIITREQRTLYQARLIDPATNQLALATFAEDGTLTNMAPIPQRDIPDSPPIKPVDPLPLKLEPAAPPREDGRDAAPGTRHGIDETPR